jgi:hypothetical protein
VKVRALRGVCVGVERHLQPGDTDDLDAAQVQFLVSIGAVERMPDEVVSVPEVPKPKLPAAGKDK